MIYDLIIVGGGPAGLTAGMYTSRAKLSTVLIEKESFGGYVPNIERVDNFPGLADISGRELSGRMLKQIRQLGVQLAMAEARLAAQWPVAIRRQTTWVHILVFWPVPVLLGFHILSAYFF